MFNLVAPTSYRPGDDYNGNSSIIDGESNKRRPTVYNPLNITLQFLSLGDPTSKPAMNLALKCYRCNKKKRLITPEVNVLCMYVSAQKNCTNLHTRHIDFGHRTRLNLALAIGDAYLAKLQRLSSSQKSE